MGIGASTEYIKQTQVNLRKVNTPDIHRAEVRQMSSNPVDRASISAPELKPQTLDLSPETPVFDVSMSSFQQLAGNADICTFLSGGIPGLEKIYNAAKAVKAEMSLLAGQ